MAIMLDNNRYFDANTMSVQPIVRQGIIKREESEKKEETMPKENNVNRFNVIELD